MLTLETSGLQEARSREIRYSEPEIAAAGANIRLSVWDAADDAPAVVFLAGTMVHPHFYRELLEALAHEGFNVVGVHFREHGLSRRDGRLFGFEDLVEDARRGVEYARSRFAGPVLVLVSATGDPLFPLEYERRVFDRITAPEKELLVFSLDHHLILNDCLPDVLPRLLETLRGYAGIPSGRATCHDNEPCSR